jgi:aryl-phospho-beta-D-glucosidase BglC (GH1 family)
MITRAKEALDRGEFLSEFIPVPKELTETMSGSYGDADKQAALEAQTRANIEKYGYGNWYDFCVGEWGTKWDVGGDGQTDVHPEGKMLHTAFDSAWSPPVNAYAKLEQLGFRVEAQFYEGGMAFAGEYKDGNCDDFSLEGMTADDIEQNYPELDDCFGISESIREYERENEEELTAWIKDGKEKLGLVEKA